MMSKIRFAPIIRVSTEKQEKKGESLATQKIQITDAVKQLGGEIPDNCWKYSGQEHATPSQERTKFDKLLSDAGKDLFDAVIVCDLSRWSRDNTSSRAGVEILMNNDIRFFVLQQELDLHDPQATLYLGISTEFNEFQAKLGNAKSQQSRISRAKKGVPAVGKCPYGRTFDKKNNKWGIDKEKQQKIKYAAEMYLAGESLPDIAKQLGMNHSNLHKILTKRSGEIWVQRFKVRKGVIEEIETKVPPLLSKRIIEKIHAKALANRTFSHGHIKHKYLLARMIFCKKCGYAMFGQTNHSGKRYYRHARHRKNKCAHSNRYLPAESIENSVLIHLFSQFYDQKGLEVAIKKAIPNADEANKLHNQLETLQKESEKNTNGTRNIIREVASGRLTGPVVEEEMAKLKEREKLIQAKIYSIQEELGNQPTAKEIKAAGSRIRKLLSKNPYAIKKATIASYYRNTERLYSMTYEEKRQLLQYFFGGKDSYGKRYGVYASKDNNKKWIFEAIGIIGFIKDRLPLKANDARNLLGIEDDSINPFTGEVHNMHQCCLINNQ